MEAKRPVSQHCDEMQDDAAKAEAREDQHGINQFQKYASAPCAAQAVLRAAKTA